MGQRLKHDELLEALNEELKRAEWEGQCHNSGWEEGVMALIAVVELHKPDDYCCPVCGPTLDVCGVEYPCPTIQAITQELVK